MKKNKSHYYILLVFISLLHSFNLKAGEVNNIEYGRLSELVSKSRVYVYSLDFETREDIVKEVEKSGHFQVVGRPEEAQFFIHYGASLAEIGSYYTHSLFWSERHSIKEPVGEMYVYSYGDRMGKGRRIRIYFGRSFDPTQQYAKAPIIGIPIALKHPAAQKAKAFMKKFKKEREAMLSSAR